MLANILFYALTGLFLGSLGLYLSYGPLSSGAWYWAYGAIQQGGAYYNLGGLVEFYRLVLVTVLFVVAQSSLFPDTARPYWMGRRLRPLSFYQHFFKTGPLWLRLFTIVLVVVTVLYSVVGGPNILRSDFEAVFGPAPLPFQEYVLPYLAYLPYTLTIYLLIALPTFVVVVQGLRDDRQSILELRSPLPEADLAGLEEGESIALEVAKIEHAIISLREKVVRILDKYLAMMAVLIIYYGIEVGTRMLAQLACWAQVGAKWAAWVLIIAVMPVFIVGTYNVYTRTYHKMQASLRELADRALRLSDREALETVNDVRGEFQGKYTFISFIWSLQTASVAVLALIVFFSIGRAYVAGLDTAERRALVDNVLPWPVYVAVDATVDFLSVGAAESTFGGVDWSLTCPADNPPADLEWRGVPLQERSGSGLDSPVALTIFQLSQ
jgi:hypothetical protein